MSENADAKDVAMRTRRCVHIDMMVTKAVDRTKTTCVKMLSNSGAMKGIVKGEAAGDEYVGRCRRSDGRLRLSEGRRCRRVGVVESRRG